ncbi:hypothetical protein NX02_19665 [Sphingomonas sanxanigenens DSM 19645 = NX02]|uniref:Uncharacterized protein n=1 Tax=Sphingomonas sanxanigenens DSM 19645 = NX02 TaxID=1123269 RepID=W0AGD3_9SPHN|nr:hypothetical protein NX02_19665 [Sphingomonas sanxanigenens DSM 19645 = NX02]
MDYDLPRNSRRQPQIVRRRHAIDNEPGLIAPAYRVNDRPGLRRAASTGQTVEARQIVESSIEAIQLLGLHQSLECLVDPSARPEIEKIHRRPHCAGDGGDAVENLWFEIE